MRAVWPAAVLALACASWPGATPGDHPAAAPEATQPAPWHIAGRTAAFETGAGRAWIIDYTLRNESGNSVALRDDEVAARLEGWVSNSRVPVHAAPRLSILEPCGSDARPFVAVVVASRDESSRCSERATIDVWIQGQSRWPSLCLLRSASAAAAGRAGTGVVAVAPGALLRVRLRIEHVHFLYGPYEPLFGLRDVTLRLGMWTLTDRVSLDPRHAGEAPVPVWSPVEPPADRADFGLFVSPPHSLHLVAETPGRGGFRVSGPVRHGSTTRVSFWYTTGAGPDPGARLRLMQLKQGPGVWESLGHAHSEFALPPAPTWTYFRRDVDVDSQATTWTLELSLGCGTGEVWVDEIRVEPLKALRRTP